MWPPQTWTRAAWREGCGGRAGAASRDRPRWSEGARIEPVSPRPSEQAVRTPSPQHGPCWAPEGMGHREAPQLLSRCQLLADNAEQEKAPPRALLCPAVPEETPKALGVL